MVDCKCSEKMRARKRACECHGGDGSVWYSKSEWHRQGRPPWGSVIWAQWKEVRIGAKHSLEGRRPRQRERLVQRPWRSVCAWESELTAVNDAGGWWDQSYKAGGTFWALKTISKALAFTLCKKRKTIMGVWTEGWYDLTFNQTTLS